MSVVHRNVIEGENLIACPLFFGMIPQANIEIPSFKEFKKKLKKKKSTM
jgi:hypothetical protein